METASLAALVASLTMAVHLLAGNANSDAPRVAQFSPDSNRQTEYAVQLVGDARAPNELTCELHGQAFFTRTPRARRPMPSLEGKIAADIPIWKTINIGTHENVRALREGLRRKRCRIGGLAGELLDQPAFTISKSRERVPLTVLAVAELGFDSKGASLSEIYARAAELGLELCPAEIGPQLRLQYLNQPLGEFLHIAMQPLATRHGTLAILVVANGGEGLLLISNDGHPDFIVPSTFRFVFVRPMPDTRPRAFVPHPPTHASPK